MHCLRTSLIICILLVHQVLSGQRPNLGHAPPAGQGSVLDGAFGGPVNQGQVMWVTAKNPGMASANPTEPPTTAAPTTKEPTTEVPTTKVQTTVAPTTEDSTTQKPTTEAPTTKEPTTEEPTTVAPTTEVPTTERLTTEAPTTVAPITDEPTTTVAPTTAKPTTEMPSTEAPTTEKLTTEEATTELPTTVVPTTKTVTTENPTIPTAGINRKPVNLSSDSTTTLKPSWNHAAGKWDFKKLPDGTPIDDLGDEIKVFDGGDGYSKVVANQNIIYVLHAAQEGKNETIFDPLTIGRVLGYLYEVNEFGNAGPPGGKYTIELFGGRIPTKFRRSAFGGKTRRATLIFTKNESL